MRSTQIARYLGIATNAAILAGLVFVLVDLRQNNAALKTANAWALVETSNQVWARLAEDEDLARMELEVGKGGLLSGVDSVRYAALVWIRLEQIWSAYDLYNAGVFSADEWRSLVEPTQARAGHDRQWSALIASGPMPQDLKAILLAKAH